MYVKTILQHDMYEAHVIVSDGIYEVICYIYHNQTNTVRNYSHKIDIIDALLVEDIFLAISKEPVVHKEPGFFSYRLQGIVTDELKPLVAVGEIIIDLDTGLPGDIKKGDWIEFKVYRLDCVLAENKR